MGTCVGAVGGAVGSDAADDSAGNAALGKVKDAGVDTAPWLSGNAGARGSGADDAAEGGAAYPGNAAKNWLANWAIRVGGGALPTGPPSNPAPVRSVMLGFGSE